MVLVDSSVWIDHFRSENKKLVTLLLNDLVLVHPFVIGEIACGQVKNRKEIIGMLRRLSFANMASFEEILFYIEEHDLSRKGLGLVDVHLLASVKLSQAKLWSLDKALVHAATTLKVVFQ